MRALVRAGPVLLALGLALTGCNKSTDSQSGAAPAKGGTGATTSGPASASSAEYVLTVEGMT